MRAEIYRVMGHAAIEEKQHFDWIDRSPFFQEYLPDGKTLHIFIENIRCAGCLRKIETADLPGVAQIRVHFADSLGVVTLEAGNSRVSPILYALEELGFPAHPMARNQELEKKNHVEGKREIKRLAVAGFCAGNIMLFSTSIYAGADEFALLFNILSFLLILPVLFYSSSAIFLQAFSALKRLQPSIDVPIALAIAVGFVISSLHLLVGKEDIYFDSIAVLVFLILSSRKILKVWQTRHFISERLNDFMSRTRPLKKVDGGWREVAADELSRGDEIRLQKGDVNPVDGRSSHDCRFDMSVLTGESLPQHVKAGQRVYAGTRLLSETVEIQVDSVGESTRLGKLLMDVRKSLGEKPEILNMTDRIAGLFSWVICTVGVGAFLGFYFWMDVSQAMSRSLAFVMIACPCALAFISPLIFSMALSKLNGLGFIVKDSTFIERLAKIQRVFFDKTGTLTNGQIRIVNWNSTDLSEREWQAVLSIEKKSDHPIANMLCGFLNKYSSELEAQNVEYVSGVGIRGTVQGHSYFIRSMDPVVRTSEKELPIRIGIEIDGTLRTVIDLIDEVKPGAVDAIQRLQKMGLEVSLLSGDNALAVENAAQTLGIDDYAARLSADEKAERVRESQSLMVGDGVNDANAMVSSQASIAVQGGAETCLKVSDAYLTRGDLTQIADAVEIGRSSVVALRRVLCVSVLYNILAGAGALAGYINPLVAAILMPTSTLLLLGIAVSSAWSRPAVWIEKVSV